MKLQALIYWLAETEMICRSHFSELTIDFCCLCWFMYIDATRQIYTTKQFIYRSQNEDLWLYDTILIARKLQFPVGYVLCALWWY
jgi:hypothetical protein